MAIKVKTPLDDETGSPRKDPNEGGEGGSTDPKDLKQPNKPDEEGNKGEKNDDDKTGKKPDPERGEGGESDVGKKTNEDDSSSDDSSEVVVVDDKEYKLDKDGNAVDDKGEVFMSKEELDRLSEEPEGGDKEGEGDRDVTIEDVEKLSGIEIYDEEGKKIEYETTLEGLAKREKDIKEMAAKSAASKAIQDFFNNNPDLYKAYVHKSKTGSLEGFTSQPFYKGMQLDEKNEDQLMGLVVEAEIKRGSSPERAKSIAKYFKTDGKLAEEGKQAHEYLMSLEEKELQEFEKSKTDNLNQQIEQEKKIYGTYYDENGREVVVDTEGSFYNKIVTKGEFGKFFIPHEGIKIKQEDGSIKRFTRRDIFDYVAKPITQDGRTQAELDEAKKRQDRDTVLYSYIINLTKGNISSLVDKAVIKEKGKGIKKRLSTSKGSSKKTEQQLGGSTKMKIKTPID